MKKFILLFAIALPLLLNAQTKGNKDIITKSFNIDGVTNLEMNLYAEVEIDASAAPTLRITADENLMALIETEPEGSKFVLTQKEWIQASERIKIFIGGADLERLQVSVHETVNVRNLNRSSFNAMAILGKIVLDGKVNELSASGEIGAIDATKLEASEVNVNLWSRGKIVLGSPDKITGKVEKDGQLIYQGNPSKVSVNTNSNGKVMSLAESKKVKNPEARFIDFKLKNNSFNRINCYVKGPKPDGSSFSYGFPMNPGQVRKKNWSVGSKVYRVTGLGTRKLLTEIKGKDEGETVKLYGEE